jgi:hypothetical protein
VFPPTGGRDPSTGRTRPLDRQNSTARPAELDRSTGRK